MSKHLRQAIAHYVAHHAAADALAEKVAADAARKRESDALAALDRRLGDSTHEGVANREAINNGG